MKPDSLLILNRSAADGRAGEQDAVARQSFETHFAFANRRTVVVPTHAAVKATARAFRASCRQGAVILSGGGAGTLRAVVEGLCATDLTPPPFGEVVVAPLRLGSGNMLARTFGVSADPNIAIANAARNTRDGLVRPCSVMRCDIDGQVHFATSLIGLGQFGRIPGDLARFHDGWPRVSRLLANGIGVERRTAIEYRTAMAMRTTNGCLRRTCVEEVDLSAGKAGERQRVRLLAGAILNFPIAGIPLPNAAEAGQAELSGLILDLSQFAFSRLRLNRFPLAVRKDEPFQIQLVRQVPTEFFLDEDPLTFEKNLRIQIAGMLGIIPGAGPQNIAPRSDAADSRHFETSRNERSS